ncbi:GyrI-like domain-containing protein [Sphingobacterium thalpophilum]|uniref:GyrI-like domain-containing protein n=1 Tax=Sphingobacterium thalpophilum TaxID=259 RepID=A0ABV4HI14_9SPHI
MNDFHLIQLNKVLDFIDKNLDEDLTLNKIADVGNYSPFHFHRLFKAYVNEPLNEYIARKRIEKIASLLIREKSKKISELSFLYGFSSNSALTKTFKRIYNISPSAFRRLSSSQYDKIINSKNGQKSLKIEQYICHINNLKNWIKMNANVIVKEINPLKMVYVSHIGVQGLDSSFYKIIDWVRKKELVSENEIDIVRIYHDSFKITPPDKVRMEIGVPVKEKVKTEFDIQYREIQPKLCVVGSFEISLDEFEKSWSSMFIWMNENGYKPSEEKPFEIIHNNYNEHPQKKCVVDFYIPVL